MSYSIRQATVEDVERIAYVRITGWRQSYKGMMPDALLEKLDIPADIGRLRKHFADPNNKSLRYVVEQAGVITGMGACGKAREEDVPGRAEIYALYLLDEAKGQGIGRAMMKEMTAALAKDGAETLQVSVLQKNAAARGFYEKLGGKLIKSGVFTYEGYDLPDVTYVWPDVKLLL